MARIELVHSPHWTTICILGDLSRDEIIDAVKLHYPSIATRDVIWDISLGSMDTLLSKDFAAIAQETKAVKRNAHGGKTAFVGSTAMVFTLACMYASVAVDEGVPAEYNAFRSLAEAEQWIQTDETSGGQIPDSTGVNQSIF